MALLFFTRSFPSYYALTSIFDMIIAAQLVFLIGSVSFPLFLRFSSLETGRDVARKEVTDAFLPW